MSSAGYVGGLCIFSPLRDDAAVIAGMDEAVTHFGRVDSCFANAGRAATGTGFLETSLEDFRSVTAVILAGAFVTLREAAKQMVAQGGGGALVVTASTAAIHGVPRGQSSATKAGVIAMTNGIAVHLASDASRYHTGDTLLIDGAYTKF